MKKIIPLLLSVCACQISHAQSQDLTVKFNPEGSHYFKFTALNQVWLRHTNLNPGSAVFDDPVSQTLDIGIRRLRFQAYGQLNDRVFFYTQFGQNNLTFMQQRFTGAFFHDAVAEYKVHKDLISIGGGLTGWSGLSRYASPAVGSILTLDAPLYQQATNSVSDQFLRKLSVYAKGKLAHLDYRLALSHPMSIQTGNVSNPEKLDSIHAAFSPKYPKMQTQGYFQWEFKDREGNVTPYTVGTYLGKKSVFNLGAGFIYQNNAMWQKNGSDTIEKPMSLMCIDLFYDAPLNVKKGSALTIYVAASRFNFAKNYIRMVGAMNPSNTLVPATASLNGTGNAFPMIGTGNILYAQIGYLLGKKTFKSKAKLQVFAATQLAQFDALKQVMTLYEGGANCYINGTTGNKLSFYYQLRPVYNKNSQGEAVTTSHKGMAVLQYQIAI
ncbi:MAG: hypothetical protein IT244_11830 [Bacteroidia bacterium]|nr:hypothetical protein [Bacteroidia bacterium]